jgi:hypothetical protein
MGLSPTTLGAGFRLSMTKQGITAGARKRRPDMLRAEVEGKCYEFLHDKTRDFSDF